MALRISFVVVLVIHTLTAMASTSSKGFSVKLIPRHMIDTDLFPKNLSLFEQHEIFVQVSRERGLYLKSLATAKSTQQNPMKTHVVRALPTLFIVQMIIGTTTPYTPYLLLDSGSDDTWIQCEGCTHCFPLSGGNFKYLQSTTFRFLSCHHPLCFPQMCYGQLCQYQMQYMGGALTGGLVSVDTFTFPYNDAYASVPNVIFGCGFDNRNIVFGVGALGPSNTVAGVFGIGAGPRSLLSQLKPVTNMRFSYCLVSWTTPEGPYSYIHYGDGAQISGDIKTLRLVPQAIPRYHLYCTGISLNGYLLPIDPRLWLTRPDGTGGFAIDTGCGVTFLVKSAYDVVRAWINRLYEMHGMQAVIGERRPYDLCYKMEPGQGYPNPTMTYHFEGGVDFVVDSNALFQKFYDFNMLCLAVMPNDDDQGPSLLGAFQQVNYRFLFDVNPGVYKVFFASQHTCFNS